MTTENPNKVQTTEQEALKQALKAITLELEVVQDFAADLNDEVFTYYSTIDRRLDHTTQAVKKIIADLEKRPSP